MAFNRSESRKTYTVTIPNGAAQPTEGLLIGNESIVAVYIPTPFTNANLRFHVGNSSVVGDMKLLYKADGNPYEITIAALEDAWFGVDPIYFLGFDYVRLLSTVNQGQDTAITVLTRHV